MTNVWSGISSTNASTLVFTICTHECYTNHCCSVKDLPIFEGETRKGLNDEEIKEMA